MGLWPQSRTLPSTTVLEIRVLFIFLCQYNSSCYAPRFPSSCSHTDCNALESFHTCHHRHERCATAATANKSVALSRHRCASLVFVIPWRTDHDIDSMARGAPSHHQHARGQEARLKQRSAKCKCRQSTTCARVMNLRLSVLYIE